MNARMLPGETPPQFRNATACAKTARVAKPRREWLGLSEMDWGNGARRRRVNFGHGLITDAPNLGERHDTLPYRARIRLRKMPHLQTLPTQGRDRRLQAGRKKSGATRQRQKVKSVTRRAFSSLFGWKHPSGPGFCCYRRNIRYAGLLVSSA